MITVVTVVTVVNVVTMVTMASRGVAVVLVGVVHTQTSHCPVAEVCTHFCTVHTIYRLDIGLDHSTAMSYVCSIPHKLRHSLCICNPT